MRLIRLLKRDVRDGIVSRSYKLIPVVITVFFMFLKLDMYLDYLGKHGNVIRQRNIMDAVLFMFEGMQVYRFDPRSFFSPPLLWLVFNIIILYFTAYYPSMDCDSYAKTLFIAGKTRVQWWFSKMIWCALSVVVCYIAAFISIFIGALVKNYEMNIDIDSEFLIYQYGNGVRYMSTTDIVLVVFILPVVISITMCEFQMLLSFIINPVVSFAFMCGIFVVSAFYTVWWLLPNFTIWRRCAYYDENGVLPRSGLLFSAYLLLATILVGASIFKRKDII